MFHLKSIYIFIALYGCNSFLFALSACIGSKEGFAYCSYEYSLPLLNFCGIHNDLQCPSLNVTCNNKSAVFSKEKGYLTELLIKDNSFCVKQLICWPHIKWCIAEKLNRMFCFTRLVLILFFAY